MIDEELEVVWVGKKMLKEVLDMVVVCGNELFVCFEKIVKE